MTLFANVVPPDVAIPFRLLSPYAPLIMIDAKINGQVLPGFILDTGNGAFGVAISKGRATQLGLKTKLGTESGFTVDLSHAYETAKVESFELGSLSERNLKIGILPAIDDLKQRMGLAVEGNIGYPFLKDYALTLDLKSSMLTLRKPEKTSGGIPLKIDPREPLVMVEAEANGVPLRFVLDTGASACCISHEAAERLGLEKGQPSSLNRSGTLNSYVSKLQSLRVGDREQHQVTVMAADFVQHLSQKLKIPIDGVLGYNFWSKYRMTIDYPNRHLILDEPQ